MPARFLQTLHTLQYTLPTKRYKTDTRTIPERIHHYTQMLTNRNCSTSDILHAFSRLNELDASIRIFEQTGLENVLKEFYSHDGQFVFAYEVNKLNQKLDKLRKNKNVQKPVSSSWEEKMEVDNEEEEYDPEYPQIRSSTEMARYKLPKTSKLLLEYAAYTPTPIRPSSIDGFSSSSSSSSGASSPSSDGEVDFVDSD